MVRRELSVKRVETCSINLPHSVELHPVDFGSEENLMPPDSPIHFVGILKQVLNGAVGVSRLAELASQTADAHRGRNRPVFRQAEILQTKELDEILCADALHTGYEITTVVTYPG